MSCWLPSTARVVLSIAGALRKGTGDDVERTKSSSEDRGECGGEVSTDSLVSNGSELLLLDVSLEAADDARRVGVADDAGPARSKRVGSYDVDKCPSISLLPLIRVSAGDSAVDMTLDALLSVLMVSSSSSSSS
jgi:hypothetical protein